MSATYDRSGPSAVKLRRTRFGAADAASAVDSHEPASGHEPGDALATDPDPLRPECGVDAGRAVCPAALLMDRPDPGEQISPSQVASSPSLVSQGQTADRS